MLRPSRLVVASVLLAVVAVGAGGSIAYAKPSSPRVWARHVCTALDTWRTSVTQRATAAGASADPTANVEVARTTLTDLFDGAARETTRLLDTVRGLAPPDVPDARVVVKRLRRGLTEARHGLTDAATAIRSAPGDLAGFIAASGAARDALDRALGEVLGTFATSISRRSARSLFRAFESERACSGISS